LLLFNQSELEQSPPPFVGVYKSRVKLKFPETSVKTILGNHVMDKQLFTKSNPYV